MRISYIDTALAVRYLVPRTLVDIGTGTLMLRGGPLQMRRQNGKESGDAPLKPEVKPQGRDE